MPRLSPDICSSLTPQVVVQLNCGGISEVLDFVCTDPEKITSSCGLSYKKVLAIRRVLLAQYSSFPVNGLSLYDETVTTNAVLPTGCSDIDELLEAGIYTGEVTEVVGPSVSGKTQFCKTLAINVATTLVQNVICIDTTSGWSVARMAEILTTRFRGACLPSVLSRIKLSQVTDLNDVIEILNQIRESLQNHHNSFYSSLKLIIIDSVAAILSPCFFKCSYVEGLAMLQEFGRKLNELAKDFAVAVIVTNNVVSSVKTNPSDHYGHKPALGRAWTFVPSIRLFFRPLNEPCQMCEQDLYNQSSDHTLLIRVIVDKSARSNTRSIIFMLSQAGIESYRKCP